MKIRPPKSLFFKLTSFYALIFGIAFILVFSSTYFMVKQELMGLVDEDLLEDVLDISTVYKEKGLRGLQAYMSQEALDDGPEEKCFLIFDNSGSLIFSTELDAWGTIPMISSHDNEGNSPLFTTISLEKRPSVRARVMGFWLKDLFIEVGVPLEWNDLVLERIERAFIVGAIFTMFFAIITGLTMTKKTLSKLREIDEVARRIADSKDLGQRVPLKGSGDELDHLATTFNLMLGRLEAFVKELSDMLDNAAHDFKTPLARIRAMAETSLSSHNLEQVTGTLVEIMNESDRFLSILNAIMDISEARTGLLDLKIEAVSVGEIMEELEAAFSGVARRKEIQMDFFYPDRDICVRGDRSRLLQALLNILDNALKFTPKGGKVTVRVWTENDKVYITISDTGPGIKEDALPRIFDRFFREDEARSSEGRGIGLSLAKALIEAQGGSIRVDSIIGKGTVFSVEMPRTDKKRV